MSTETWKPIEGFDNYEISSKGRIAKRNILKPGTSNSGYPYVILSKEGKTHYRYVHILLMQTYKGKPPADKPIVLHLDDDPANIELSNMVYGSKKDNTQDCIEKGRFSNKAVSIQQISLDGDIIKTYKSVYEAWKLTGISYLTILGASKRGIIAKGFYWKRI